MNKNKLNESNVFSCSQSTNQLGNIILSLQRTTNGKPIHIILEFTTQP